MTRTPALAGSLRPQTGKRRAFFPRDIRGCVQWLDASRGITITGAGVSAWTDLSGQGNNATQGTDSKRPTVNASGLNGRPTIVFTGDNFLAHTTRVVVPCTIAFVAKTTLDDGVNYAFVGTWSNSLGGAAVFAKPGTPHNWGYYANANALSGATILNTFKRCVAVARANNDIDFRTNGSSVTVATGISAYSVASAIGSGNGVGTQNLEGELAELAAYDRALSVPECMRLESYFQTKFAL